MSELRTRAFGLSLAAGFPMPGISHEPELDGERRVELQLAPREEIERDWPRDEAQRISEVRLPDGRPALWVDSAEGRGHLAYASDFGTARIAPGHDRVLIAHEDQPDWVWQRFLTGQLLPLVAVLQGVEVFHASVMVRDGGAIAIVAASGAGKTTLALRLMLAGLGWASDDVLAVEPDGDGLLVHPGLGLANIRPGGEELLTELQERRLAVPIGRNEHETRASIRRRPEPVPLRALFFLIRYAEPRELLFERLQPVDPRLLLGATFNLAVRTPARLERQLDVCARLDRTVAVTTIHCGRDVEAQEVVEGLLNTEL